MLEVIQQLLSLAGVLAGDAVHAAQDAQCAQGDVLEVADGGGDEVEAGCTAADPWSFSEDIIPAEGAACGAGSACPWSARDSAA